MRQPTLTFSATAHIKIIAMMAWLGCLLALGAGPVAADWPQILGPERNGRVEGALPSAFSGEGTNSAPQSLWQYSVGEGMAGVAVAGDRVFISHRVSGRDGNVERVEALSTQDGAVIWSSDAPASYRGGILPDSGPRAVPAVHGDTVITLGASGRLRALSAEDGAERWNVDLAGTYQAPEGYFGFGSSPLVLSAGGKGSVGKDLVIIVAGGQGAAVLAFDLASGAEVWRAVDDRASYSSPVLSQLGGREQLVAISRLTVIGLEPASGEELWSLPFGRRGPSAIGAVPVAAGGQLLITASYGVGARLLDFSKMTAASRSTSNPKVANKFTPEEVWSGDQLSSHYPTPVVIGGTIYSIDGREDHGTGQLRAYKLATGDVLWTEKDYGMAHLLTDGERLLAQRLDGALDLIAADPTGFKRLDTAKVALGTVRALPAFSDGVLYLRTTPRQGGGEVLALPLR